MSHLKKVDSDGKGAYTVECNHRDSLHELCSPGQVAAALAARFGAPVPMPCIEVQLDRGHRMRRPERVHTAHI
jgi:hypothetical protein